MRFAYTYRSSDGARHAAEIEAGSRDEAFARVRAELGIKPIRVTAAAGGGDIGWRRHGRRRAAAWAAAGLCAAALAAGAWRWAAGGRDDRPYRVMTPQGPVTYTVAAPLPRQTIPGDRRRIEEALREGGENVFRSPAERLLARFAEPGRAPALRREGRPADAEFAACLREPVRIASTDFTEVVDLKRIVAGMKREMRAYLAGGGTAGGYLAELEKRQRLEISYRGTAERRLGEMLRAREGGGADAALRDAYDYWLKANAQLKSMGIWELPLPDALRAYQMSLDLDE